MKRFWNLLAGTLVVLTVVSAASGAIVINDEASFLSAIQPGFYLEQFNGFTAERFYASPLGFGPTNGFAYDMSADNGLYSFPGIMSTSEAGDALVIDFTNSPSPVTAVGGNFWPTVSTGGDPVGIIKISLSDGTDEVVTITDPDSHPFRGFVSDGALFTSMSIKTDYTVNPIFPTVDNFYVGQVVPVPSAVLLGIIGLGYAGRRLRRRTA